MELNQNSPDLPSLISVYYSKLQQIYTEADFLLFVNNYPEFGLSKQAPDVASLEQPHPLWEVNYISLSNFVKDIETSVYHLKKCADTFCEKPEGRKIGNLWKEGLTKFEAVVKACHEAYLDLVESPEYASAQLNQEHPWKLRAINSQGTAINSLKFGVSSYQK